MKKSILALLAAFMLASCGLEKSAEPLVTTDIEETTVTQEAISVTSSIVPVSSVINAIGGEYVEVNTIVPAGVSPHGFDLSAKDVVAIEDSEIAFIIGLEQIDGFLEKALANKKHIELAEGVELLEAAAHSHSDNKDEYDEHVDVEHHDDEEYEDEHEDKHDEKGHEDHVNEHDEHNVDAHIWLGEENIMKIAGKIRAELMAIMPEHADIFIKNTEIFTEEVNEIYEDFRETHRGKTAEEFIVFHDAYNYLMQSAGIDSDLKIPFSENVLHESGTAHMAELIEEIELHGVVNIFTEPQFSDGNVQNFADEYNLTVGILDPLGADESAAGYLENLKTNLDNLSLIYE